MVERKNMAFRNDVKRSNGKRFTPFDGRSNNVSASNSGFICLLIQSPIIVHDPIRILCTINRHHSLMPFYNLHLKRIFKPLLQTIIESVY